jgi:hypothetical protein
VLLHEARGQLKQVRTRQRNRVRGIEPRRGNPGRIGDHPEVLAHRYVLVAEQIPLPKPALGRGQDVAPRHVLDIDQVDPAVHVDRQFPRCDLNDELPGGRGANVVGPDD